MRLRRTLAVLGATALLGSLIVIAPVAVSARSAGTTSLIPKVGTSAPQTGDFTPSGAGDVTDEEFAGETDAEQSPDALTSMLETAKAEVKAAQTELDRKRAEVGLIEDALTKAKRRENNDRPNLAGNFRPSRTVSITSARVAPRSLSR